jgi:hypothetical protein
MLWRNGCDGKVLRCGAGDRHQHSILITNIRNPVLKLLLILDAGGR